MKKFWLTLISFFVIGILMYSNGYSQRGPHVPLHPSPIKTFDVAKFFTASGWMGGTKFIQLFEGWRENPHSKPVCIKVVYTPGREGEGWGGIYWQNKPDNWGDMPGEDFSRKGYRIITFWARGERGIEIVEFKAGGIKPEGKKYSDSFEVSTGKVYLEKDWKKYTIDLEGTNLSSVIGGFCWVASHSANPNGLTFYVDDIQFE